MKKTMNYFIRMEFFQNHKFITKHFYLLYSIAAGMYYETYIRRWFRYSLLIFALTSSAIVLTCCFVTLLQLRAFDFIGVVSSLSNVCCEIGFLVVTAATYYWRENLREVFETVNTHFEDYESLNTKLQSNDRSYQMIDYLRGVKLFYVLGFLTCFLGYFIKLVLSLVLKRGQEFSVNYSQDYLYPFPFIESATKLEYIFIYIFEVVTFLPMGAYVSSTFGFLIFVPIHFKNQVLLLTNEIKLEADSTMIILEKLDASKSPPCILLQQKKKIKDDFTEQIKEWIQRHHKIISTINKLKGFAQTILGIMLTWMLISTVLTLHISSMTVGSGDKAQFMYAVVLLPYLFLSCLVGDIYETMMNDMVYEIYAMPWYHLPPKERKLILNFLTLAQSSSQLYALKVIPVSLVLFPKIMSKAYSYVRIIRAVEMKNLT